MDEITGEANTYATALLGADGRREHAKKSPDCTKHADWIHGWDKEIVPAQQASEQCYLDTNGDGDCASCAGRGGCNAVGGPFTNDPLQSV